MKNRLLLLTTLLFVSCGPNSPSGVFYVDGMDALTEAIRQAHPGSEIVLANGVWTDAEIAFYAIGTADQPITLRAEEPGKVTLEGNSYLQLGGQHLIVEGLYFRNGYSPLNSVISFQISEDSTAFHSRVTNCVIENFTKPSRLINDHWIEFYGQHNSLDHCYISGKSNDGETLRVFQTGNQHNSNHHRIVNNYFGPRPRKGGPRAETIRIGDSKTHMTPGYVTVADNYFEACNGEVEVISDKTNFNEFRNNVFYKCEGSLVLRHGSFATVDGNLFIGGDESDFYGGIRVINTGHWITNNYFYKINGSEFRSPLAVMNGIPKSQLNRYRQVTDVVVAHNTWVDCRSPWQIGVGQNTASADVLPEVEIRSAPPIRSIIANNLIYNHTADEMPVINHDNIDGIQFRNNVLDNDGRPVTAFDALGHQQIEIHQINDWLYAPKDQQSGLITGLYHGFDFDKISEDLFGNSREAQNYVGAISQAVTADRVEIDPSNYGPSWYSPNQGKSSPRILTASADAGELAKKIEQANSGDIIELTDDVYQIDISLPIDKDITIRPAEQESVKLIYTGAANTPAFRMHPYGSLRLRQLEVEGQNNQVAFAPLAEDMAAAYKLSMDQCLIREFGAVLIASQGSFADSISLHRSTIADCEQGIILAADEKGDYNAEMVRVEACEFRNIGENVIHFYRGGYDESTIGGSLTMIGNTFTGCGGNESSGVLLKTRGIINVLLAENTFRNNPVSFVAILWGAKNNHHRDNTVTQSGQIKVEEQQKLEILY